ncbi:LysR family transcriptional regulator [Streptosporangiaceae bacterium NEAU-GS5]|nr:LysR family transcriptional regulator [Streptosporangiaceae bacterium NEAU-GS5]
MSFDSWQAYLEVCRLGSVSAAAAELGYTQSALSRQMTALEREVGVRLLERHSRGMVPTAAGEAFRQHARVAVNAAARAVRAAKEARDDAPATPLAVGATPSTAAGIVPAALRRLVTPWTLQPALTPQLHAMTTGGELDVAAVTDAPPGLPDDARLVRELIGIDEMCVIVPPGHPAAGRDIVEIGQLAADTWVEDNDGSAALLRQSMARAGHSARVDFAAADLMGKMALVAGGHAIALVPGVLSASMRRDVTPVRLADPPRRGIYVIMQHATPERIPAATTLVGHLRDAMDALDRGRGQAWD